MRTVVLGAGGLLGRHVREELAEDRRLEVTGYDHASCPIDDAERVREAVRGANLVVNCAAYTDVDGAEREPERAFRTNELGAEQVACAAAAEGTVLVHVSTDFVFDGTKDSAYDESDEPRPESLYARSKRAGELAVLACAPRHHIVRVQALYGRGGQNFASRLRELILDRRAGLRLDGERRIQPTWARAAARAIAGLAATDRYGVWHASCRGETTWYEFAGHLARRLDRPLDARAVSSGELALPARRPHNCLLGHRRLDEAGLPPTPTWQEALDGYLAEMAECGTERRS